MATLASLGGNFTSAGSWALVDATSYAERSLANSNTQLTTSYVSSSTFTPGAITIDGLAVFVYSRSQTPSGTLTVALDQGGSDVAGTVVTINVVDLGFIVGQFPGWVFFKFSAPVTLAAATAYSVKAKTSVATQVNLGTVATTNHARFLRTTTTQAPAAGDVLIVVGERTGAGTGTDVTITLDNTATTTFGYLHFCQRSTFTLATAGSTNYYLKTSGISYAYVDAYITLGSVGTPLPVSSTFTWEFAPAAQVGAGLDARGSIISIVGAPKTGNLTKLTADAAIGATTLNVEDTTDWVVGDEIIIASTTRVATECEKRTILTIPTSTTVTVAALTYAHSATGLTVAEVANLTRNIKIKGTSTSLQGYIFTDRSGIYFANTEFLALGSNTANKRGININITNYDVTITNCSFHDSANNGQALTLTAVSSATGITSLTYNVTYNFANTHISIASGLTLLNPITIDHNYLIFQSASGFYLLQYAITTDAIITNNVFVGNASTIYSTVLLTYSSSAQTIAFDDNIIHSSANIGLDINDGTGTTQTIDQEYTGNLMYRLSQEGLNYGRTLKGYKTKFIDFTIFGTNNNAVEITSPYAIGEIIFDNLQILPDALYADTNYGIFENSSNGLIDKVLVYNSDITAIIFIMSANTARLFRGEVYNSTLSPVAASTAFDLQGEIIFDYFNGVSGSYYKKLANCTLTKDTTIYNSAPSSARVHIYNGSVAPVITTMLSFFVPVSAGETITPTVMIRKNTFGDVSGHEFIATPPDLIVKSSPILGTAEDTVVATASGANGTWLPVSGSVGPVLADGILEFAIQVNTPIATVGTDYFWVDDFSVITSNSLDSKAMDVSYKGQPVAFHTGNAASNTLLVHRPRRIM
jgi:hypothetical protein